MPTGWNIPIQVHLTGEMTRVHWLAGLFALRSKSHLISLCTALLLLSFSALRPKEFSSQLLGDANEGGNGL